MDRSLGRTLLLVVGLPGAGKTTLALLGPSPCVVLTDPGTGPRRRWLLLGLARLGGRAVHVRLLDVPDACAREGQRRRGRALSPAAMDRHVARWAAVRADPARAFRGAASVAVLRSRLPAARPEPAPLLAHAGGRS